MTDSPHIPETRLADIRQRYGDTVGIGDLKKIIEDLAAASDQEHDDLLQELIALGNYLHAIRADLAAARPHDLREEYINSATDELDAIVQATADATNTIMDATEIVEDVMAALEGDPADKLMDATTKIYEACTFQDITGQRIGKVVRALSHIEARVDALVTLFDAVPHPAGSETAPKTDLPATPEDKEAGLLEGPQLEGQGVSQADVDALLRDFD
ncbi:MAG: protein phosphatase CheZ [Magnetospiraceae bacterium]